MSLRSRAFRSATLLHLPSSLLRVWFALKVLSGGTYPQTPQPIRCAQRVWRSPAQPRRGSDERELTLVRPVARQAHGAAARGDLECGRHIAVAREPEREAGREAVAAPV